MTINCNFLNNVQCTNEHVPASVREKTNLLSPQIMRVTAMLQTSPSYLKNVNIFNYKQYIAK